MDVSGLVIGAMRVEDVEGACALWYSIPELKVSREFDSAERVQAYVERNPGFGSVAWVEGRMVGAVMCGHDGRRGSFYHAGILPAFRRRGIGKRMVERSLGRLREAGIVTAFLFTHEGNAEARAFWGSLKWEECAEVRYWFRGF